MKYIITESQYVLLSESLSPEVRRRLPFKNMMNDLEYGILDEIPVNPESVIDGNGGDNPAFAKTGNEVNKSTNNGNVISF